MANSSFYHQRDEFFRRPGWRKQLSGLAKAFIREHGISGRYETEVEKRERIITDLSWSKQTIEEQVNTEVTHLCYPWYIASSLAVDLSRQVGFVANHWGILDQRTIAGVGCDPYYIGRMSDDYLVTLPGKGLIALLPLLLKKALATTKRNLFHWPRVAARL